MRCVHCFAKHLVSRPQNESGELNAERILALLSEAATLGCLKLTLSGGDPLMRKDFAEIYAGARRLGMVVTVFTNATLVTQAHVDLFREYPPKMVEVSLYGATRDTYERVTRVPGSYDKALRGIDLLLGQGVAVGLKTMILTENAGEIPAIGSFASDLGLRFRLDPVVTPGLDGDCSLLSHRVEPDLAARLQLSRDGDIERLKKQHERFEARRGKRPPDPAGVDVRCGAGVSVFHLDPGGWMRPCIMIRGIAHNAADQGFADAWRRTTRAIDATVTGRLSPCAGCEDLFLCGFCPGLFDLEGSYPTGGSEYVCRLGRSRRAMLEATEEVKDDRGK